MYLGFSRMIVSLSSSNMIFTCFIWLSTSLNSWVHRVYLHSGNFTVGSETVVDSLDRGRLHGSSAQTKDKRQEKWKWNLVLWDEKPSLSTGFYLYMHGTFSSIPIPILLTVCKPWGFGNGEMFKTATGRYSMEQPDRWHCCEAENLLTQRGITRSIIFTVCLQEWMMTSSLSAAMSSCALDAYKHCKQSGWWHHRYPLQ